MFVIKTALLVSITNVTVKAHRDWCYWPVTLFLVYWRST